MLLNSYFRGKMTDNWKSLCNFGRKFFFEKIYQGFRRTLANFTREFRDLIQDQTCKFIFSIFASNSKSYFNFFYFHNEFQKTCPVEVGFTVAGKSHFWSQHGTQDPQFFPSLSGAELRRPISNPSCLSRKSNTGNW